MPGKTVWREETYGIGRGKVGRDYGFLIRYDGGMSYGVWEPARYLSLLGVLVALIVTRSELYNNTNGYLFVPLKYLYSLFLIIIDRVTLYNQEMESV